MGFKQEFFKIYDRKIASGEITFSKSGISKTDFTRLCMEPDYVFEEDALSGICERMLLNDAEIELLYKEAGYRKK